MARRQQAADAQRGDGRVGRVLLRALAFVATVLVVAAGGFLVWGLTPLAPDAAALAALKSGDGVAVTHDDGAWIFLPDAEQGVPDTGLIFYPGGHVDARSYAPFARALAAEGHAVVIVEMPLSLAVLKPDAADEVLVSAQLAEVTHWAVGGHSLGGAMAAQYLAAEAPEAVEGLLLLAAYAPEGADLSDSGLAVTDVTGSLDAVLDQESWEAGKALLPPDTRRVSIEGGNHAGFGSYGAQPGDSAPTLSSAEQLRQTVRTADELLDSL